MTTSTRRRFYGPHGRYGGLNAGLDEVSACLLLQVHQSLERR
ncbi:MAG TPA: hypothetical protein PLX54_01285 [Candidatus Fermentibacter daniensis]|nr:hypothetical protein [Candidatus Fermentibacter daniensis]HOF66070.1 hypothetical protein [Candidatus Fermentibacter daniensis]HOR06761.1 hypothetical protein [Candidatus Fermentibacter daniensis]HPK50990.1 hypothetical protein [Candidatus Fermentibacter daniensis]HQM40821.1 hypothetical protein [Candidatus Fermentibacter daniensis]